ncbi:MAG: response regulator, partial [bacterium]|nr:response regulator [bacterium]
NKLVFQKWVRSEEILPAWLIPGLIIIGIFIFLSFIFSIIFILKVQVRRKTNELKLANKKIEATAIQRQRLFQSLAHELKTPLTLIKNYLEQDISKRGSTKDLDIVHKNVGKLINEVVKYMDVSKIERDHFKFNHNQLIDLTSFIESKVEHFEKAAKTKSISLCMELEKAVFIEADPSAIDKVMNNLLDNALKFMGKGNITVMLCKINDNIVDLVVRDTGPGIPESQLENIFKPYYQMLPEKGHYYGMGMGLYIVKSIMDSIGSTIIVKSKIGEGTIFTISFKIVRTSNEENIVKCIESSYSDGIPTVIKKLKEKNIAEDKLNILIIEDNLEMLDFLQSAFKENYNVYLATNGKEAIDKLENISMPEIIISDMMMPIMDGEVFLSKLLENENCKNIPLIFLTARTTDNEKIKALSEGAFDYIYKPFNIEELKAKVKTIIKNKKSVIQNNSDNIKDKMLEYFESINNIKELKKENNFDGMCFKYKITKKEYEIMKLISEGLYSKEIAGKLNCSTRTVENHISHIYSKIGVSGRVELVNFINNFN